MAENQTAPTKIDDLKCIVYQMGKVGSESIEETLLKSGINTKQTHFLAKQVLDEVYDQFFNDEGLSTWKAHHQAIALGENLRLYNYLNQIKARKVNRRLKVITLCRHPIDWWLSEYFQNWPAYQHTLARWYELNSRPIDLERITAREIADYLQAALTAYMKYSFPLLSSSDGIDGADSRTESTELLLADGNRMFRPLGWFDTSFKEPICIDVYAQPFDPAKGYAIWHTEFFDVLMLRFENLQMVGAHAINELFEQPICDQLTRKNTTSRKPGISSLYQQVRAIFDVPQSTRAALHETKYCRAFYPDGHQLRPVPAGNQKQRSFLGAVKSAAFGLVRNEARN